MAICEDAPRALDRDVDRQAALRRWRGAIPEELLRSVKEACAGLEAGRLASLLDAPRLQTELRRAGALADGVSAASGRSTSRTFS